MEPNSADKKGHIKLSDISVTLEADAKSGSKPQVQSPDNVKGKLDFAEETKVISTSFLSTFAEKDQDDDEVVDIAIVDIAVSEIKLRS